MIPLKPSRDMDDSKSIPGYARPTKSSTGRQKTIQSIMENRGSRTSWQARTSDTSKAGCNTTVTIVRWETYRGFSASTIASRSRAGNQRPFRFTALPAELRNQVYEYLDIEHPRHYVCLYDGRFPDLETFPRLLHVSKQLCLEAGSLYFNTTRHLIF